MINFFRRIRKKLADDNQLLKYSRYAIGEIVLVVIGILIALQINTWNEEARQYSKKDKLIVRLKKQVENNLNSTQFALDFQNKIVTNIDKLMSLIGSPVDPADHNLIDSLFEYPIYDYCLCLELNILNQAMDNGELSLIRNDSLRILLYQFPTAIHDYIINRENTMNTENLQFMYPYYRENMNMRNLNSGYESDYKKRIGYSRLEGTNYTKILTDREFENLLDMRAYSATEMQEKYAAIMEILRLINKLLEEEQQ